MSTVWSIVIPTFHRPDLLKAAVASCYAQEIGSDQELEIVVVDNSDDGNAMTICSMLNQGNLRYIHEARTGLAFARNRGIEEATGKYLAFLDDDEVAMPSWIGELNHAFLRSKADVVFGKVIPRLENPEINHSKYVTNFYTRDIGQPALSDVADLLNYVGTGNSAYRRDACFSRGIRADERFNFSGGEDIDLFRKLKRQGCQFAWAPDAIVSEWVPNSRTTLAYLKERRWSQGQQRVDDLWRAGSQGRFRVPAFMVGGGVQATMHAGVYLYYRLMCAHHRAREHAVEIQGGLGKLLWTSAHRRKKYGVRSSS
jgi:glycosyltransferase involved in cell wall biosynthesis